MRCVNIYDNLKLKLTISSYPYSGMSGCFHEEASSMESFSKKSCVVQYPSI